MSLATALKGTMADARCRTLDFRRVCGRPADRRTPRLKEAIA